MTGSLPTVRLAWPRSDSSLRPIDDAPAARAVVAISRCCAADAAHDRRDSLPESPDRFLFGIHLERQVGLHGEPNYNAMLYGVVGIMLGQQTPRCLGLLPSSRFRASRGVVVAAAGWLGAKLLGRPFARVAWVFVLLLCARPLIVLAVDSAIGVRPGSC